MNIYNLVATENSGSLLFFSKHPFERGSAPVDLCSTHCPTGTTHLFLIKVFSPFLTVTALSPYDQVEHLPSCEDNWGSFL